ncbi:GNAT family N-acetyltransferase [Iodobacter sp.]|uniref:GNAT family N-acetyltransferase n=1 Tax=Iodobacter sp. TaxID=1915058 RepID=UPI0025F7D2D2|nr:GNAT family N-acetyltransferase [Iodobacter sp.]
MISSQFVALLNKNHAVAAQIHAVQMAAYSQEAELLGVKDFPPLQVTVVDIQESCENFYGAYQLNELVGVVSICKKPCPDSLCISSLVVKPSAQRRQVGSGLLARALSLFDQCNFTVSTAAKNVPAVSLYSFFGFIETRRWLASPDNIELIELSKIRFKPLPKLTKPREK